MNNTFGSVGCGSMLWGITSESVLRAEVLLGNEECDVDADKPDAIGNGAGQNDGAAEVKNARLVEDIVADSICVSLIAHDASVT